VTDLTDDSRDYHDASGSSVGRVPHSVSGASTRVTRDIQDVGYTHRHIYSYLDFNTQFGMIAVFVVVVVVVLFTDMNTGLCYTDYVHFLLAR